MATIIFFLYLVLKKCIMLCVRCYMSCVTCQLSGVICNGSHVTNANSHSQDSSLIELPHYAEQEGLQRPKKQKFILQGHFLNKISEPKLPIHRLLSFHDFPISFIYPTVQGPIKMGLIGHLTNICPEGNAEHCNI